MGRYYLKVLLLAGLASFRTVSGQSDTTLRFLPDGRIFPQLVADPLECQNAGGSYLLEREGSDMSLYSIVNLGFSRPLFGRQSAATRWEVNFGAAVFSQFDLIRREDDTYLAGLLNTDFKVSTDFSLQRRNNLLRFRVFHISSHLGDDYVQRHSDTIVNDKSVNYEQVDITYLRKAGSGYFYAGTGYIYTIDAFRERFSFQAGGLMNFREREKSSLFTGSDIKLLQENGFSPDIRLIAGLSLLRGSGPTLRVWAECYSGKLPYSTIDYGRVSWFGLALAINVFNVPEY